MVDHTDAEAHNVTWDSYVRFTLTILLTLPMQVLPCYHCFPLPDLDASLHSSYYFGDPKFTSLRRFAPNVLGIAAHLGSLHTGWGRYRDRAPFGGASH